MVVDRPGDDKLVGLGALHEGVHLLAHLIARADRSGREYAVQHPRKLRRQALAIAFDGGRQLARLAGPQAYEALLHRAGEQLRLFLGIGGEDVVATDRIGLAQHSGRLEPFAVDLQRVIQRLRREVAGKGVGQAQHRRDLRAEQAGAEDIELHIGTRTGSGPDPGAPVIGEIALQLDHVAREGIGIAVEIAAQRGGDPLVAARRAAQPQIDSPGEERVERAELLRDHQRGMIGQHDPTRADADLLGPGSDMADHHRCRGAGDPFHPVMLRAPVSLEPQCFGMACHVDGVGERAADVATFGDVEKVEQGEFCHATQDGGGAAKFKPAPA